MNYIKEKTKNEILDELRGTAEPGSPVHEQQKMGIMVRCTEDLEMALKKLENSMNKNADSSHSLAQKVFYLNIILTIATALGFIFTVYFNFRG
ncbi:MAG: hypothetical protein ABIH00_08800 [Armatimonadota bacterium]